MPCKQARRILRRYFVILVILYLYRRTGSTTHQVIRQEVSRGAEQDNGVEVHVDPLVKKQQQAERCNEIHRSVTRSTKSKRPDRGLCVRRRVKRWR